MGISVFGKHVIGDVTPASPVRRASRSIRELVAEQLEARAQEEEARKIEERETLPVDSNRPIFNSLVDRKENSRYMLDLVKV